MRGGESKGRCSTSGLSPWARPFTFPLPRSAPASVSASLGVGRPQGQSFSHPTSKVVSFVPPGDFSSSSSQLCSLSFPPDYSTSCGSGAFLDSGSSQVQDDSCTTNASTNTVIASHHLQVDQIGALCFMDEASILGLHQENPYAKGFTLPSDSMHAEWSPESISSSIAYSGAAFVKFPASLDFCPTSASEDPQSRQAYPVSALTWSCSDSTLTSCERRFSEQLHFTSTSELEVPSLSKTNSFPMLVSDSVLSSSSTSDFNYLQSYNVDSDDHGAVSCNNILSYNSFDRSPIMLKAKEVFRRKSLIDENMDGRNGKGATCHAVDNPSLTKSEVQSTSSGAHDLLPKCYNLDEADGPENPCKKFDENDSDVDSPCWKGTLATDQFAARNSELSNSQHLGSGRETCRNLNPQAPHFFPSYNKLSMANDACSALDIQHSEPRLQKSLTRELSSLEPSVTGSTCSSDSLHFTEQEGVILTVSNGRSTVSSSCRGQPLHMEHHLISDGRLMTGLYAGGSLKDIKDVEDYTSTSVSLSTTEYIFNSTSSKVGNSSGYAKAGGMEIKSLSAPPRLSIQTAVNTIDELSNLLMQYCLYNADSLNDHERDIIEHTVDNLTVCIRNCRRREL